MYSASRHPLQTIVADRRCGVQAFRDIALVENLALIGGVGPDAGEAVGLELEAHGELIGNVGAALLQLVHPVGRTEEILHVVPDFVGEHVRLRKVAAGSEALLQLVVEAKIDVGFPVERTIEGAAGRLGRPARRLHHVPEQHELRHTVLRPHLGQQPGPGGLHIVKHE